MGNTTFSVLICTYQRHEMLRMALSALIERTTEKPDQIVIVNGGDEQADDVVKAFSVNSAIDICLIKTANRNLATSRNIGLEACRGDIVAMTDDDAEVFPDWVTNMKQIHAEYPDTGAVGGAVLGASSDEQLISRLADIVTFPSPKIPTEMRNLPGVNVSYKREVIQRIGLQDTTLFRGEDVDYNWRVKRAGYRLLYHPSIKVIHHHRPSLRTFLRQHYMYGRAYYLVRQKWDDMYCIYPKHLRSLKDVRRLGWFVLSLLIQPIQTVKQLHGAGDMVRALPVLYANQLIWRAGIVYQWRLDRRRSEHPVGSA